MVDRIYRQVTEAAATLGNRARTAIDELGETTVRVGVTGLARAGKTVFVTSLVDNLLKPQRLGLLDAVAEGRYQTALLRPQPDDHAPRFDYEGHVAAVTAEPPHWPEPTRTLSQLRVSVRYQPASFWQRQLADARTLNIDIVDYPGEWLTDLSLLTQSYADWSRRAWSVLNEAPAAAPRDRCRELVRAADPAGPADETTARDLAEAFRAAIRAAGPEDWQIRRIAPGRFRVPGDLEGAPLMTFAPLPPTDGAATPRESLWRLMERRFDSYRRTVSRRFFEDQFARLDRQIVLVDLPSVAQSGPDAVRDFQELLDDVLSCFRYGRSAWPRFLFGTRIDKVLFAATKADLIPSSQHANMVAFLDSLLFDAMNRIRYLRTEVATTALAALRASTDQTVLERGDRFDCVLGRHVGEAKARYHWPGAFPRHYRDVRTPSDGSFRVLPFEPPERLGRDGRGLPHIGLDKAIQVLVGDHLA